MSSVKVLVVGSANGDLHNLCSKVKSMNDKHGPFDILFCTGNFFGRETPMETIDDLLENKLDFPMTTYFIGGDNGVPGIIERTALRKNGEICNNLFYLGTHGVMTTAQSVKIASLSGTYDSTIYEADIEDEDFDKALLRGRYTKPSIEGLVKAIQPTSIMDTSKRGVDIFLSHEWPIGIIKPGPTPFPTAPPANLVASTFSHPIATAAGALQPRYHFAGSSGQFWERLPYKNVGGAEHATRFISLGDVGNKNKQRWFYAFNLVPLANASEDLLQSSVTENTTESPLATNAELKRGREQTDEAGGFFWDSKRVRNEPPAGYICRRCNQPGHFIKECTMERGERSLPEGYICKKCNEPGHHIKECPKFKEGGSSAPVPEGYVCNICHKPGHWIQECPDAGSNRKKRSAQQSSQQQPPPPCWFCLSNPDVDKNLIVSIGTEVYMTMAKGQLPTTPSNLIPGGGHVILITINHYSTFGAVEADARQDLASELQKYKDGLSKLFQSKGAAIVTWELSQSGRLQHAHVQVMAVPQNKVADIERQFREDVQSFFVQGKPGRDQASEDSQPKHTATWQDELPEPENQGYLKIEVANKVMVCPIPERQWIDPQFSRSVLAKALGTPDRANWRNCVKIAEEERKDSQAFKLAFKNYDFTL